MDLHSATVFTLSLLTVLSNIGLFVGVSLYFLRKKPKPLKPAFGFARKYAVFLALTVSIFATTASFVLSELLGFAPCSLCIVQRALMYPIPIVLGLALFFRAKQPMNYSLPFALGGAIVSLYHIFLQIRGSETPFCGALSSNCEIIEFINFGYVTIPVMALSGFLAIAFLWLISIAKE